MKFSPSSSHRPKLPGVREARKSHIVNGFTIYDVRFTRVLTKWA
jgi:hypothetical protein